MGLKGLARVLIPARILEWREAAWQIRPMYERSCPICGFHGMFLAFGRPLRIDAQCPQCMSLERHRLLDLWLKSEPGALSEPIVHFAPEAILEGKFRAKYRDYRTADISANADLQLNIEKIDLPDSCVRAVVCNHVLEHVNDRQALSEICRILTDDGCLVASVPIIEGWDRTYEDERIVDPGQRETHFGQDDHVRYYGRDFRERIREAGFTRMTEFTAGGRDSVQYGLLRGEKIFICGKR